MNKVLTVKSPITASTQEMYELIQSDDGLCITIRNAGHREQQLKFSRSVVPSLINALRKLQSTQQS